MSQVFEQQYWILGAGGANGPVYFGANDFITPGPLLAFHFATSAEAEGKLTEVRDLWPGLDWRVFGLRAKFTLDPA